MVGKIFDVMHLPSSPAKTTVGRLPLPVSVVYAPSGRVAVGGLDALTNPRAGTMSYIVIRCGPWSANNLCIRLAGAQANPHCLD